MILILYTNLGLPCCLNCEYVNGEYISWKALKQLFYLTYIAVVFCPTHTGCSFAKNTVEATILLYTNMAAFFLSILKGDDNTAIITYTEVVFCPLSTLTRSIFFYLPQSYCLLVHQYGSSFPYFFPKRWWHHMKRLYICKLIHMAQFLSNWALQYLCLCMVTIYDYPNLIITQWPGC